MFVLNQLLMFKVPVELFDLNIKKTAALVKEISKLFIANCEKEKKILAACQRSDKSKDLDKINREALFGGLIEVDDSKLKKLLKWSKISRSHATFHDAAGYLKKIVKLGLGYCYKYHFDNYILNICFLGHIAGLAYCCLSKMSPQFQLIKVWITLFLIEERKSVAL